MSQPRFAKIAAMNLPAPRFSGKRDLRYFRCFSLQTFQKTEFCCSQSKKARLRLIQDSLARPIYQTEAAGSIECKNRDINFFHYLAKERSSFQSAQPLLPQSLPQGIYLAQNLAQCIFAVGGAREWRNHLREERPGGSKACAAGRPRDFGPRMRSSATQLP